MRGKLRSLFKNKVCVVLQKVDLQLFPACDLAAGFVNFGLRTKLALCVRAPMRFERETVPGDFSEVKLGRPQYKTSVCGENGGMETGCVAASPDNMCVS